MNKLINFKIFFSLLSCNEDLTFYPIQIKIQDASLFQHMVKHCKSLFKANTSECHGLLPPLLAFSFGREVVVEHHPLAEASGNHSFKVQQLELKSFLFCLILAIHLKMN